MEINIIQKSTSPPNDYAIEIEQQTRYYGYVRSRKQHTYIDIVTLRGVQPKVSVEIKKDTRSFKQPIFEIHGIGKEAIVCSPGPRRDNKYQLIYNDDVYEIIGHKNNIASIFKNEKQIGSFSNLTVFSFLNSYKCRLLLDFDCDLRILLSLAMIWENVAFSSEGIFPALIFHFGQWREKRKRDVHWKPKERR